MWQDNGSTLFIGLRSRMRMGVGTNGMRACGPRRATAGRRSRRMQAGKRKLWQVLCQSKGACTAVLRADTSC